MCVARQEGKEERGQSRVVTKGDQNGRTHLDIEMEIWSNGSFGG